MDPCNNHIQFWRNIYLSVGICVNETFLHVFLETGEERRATLKGKANVLETGLKDG